MTYQLPPSVLAYCVDAGVRAGVDTLLARPNRIPSDLQWNELAEYYAAWAAAHRVAADHAASLLNLWSAVWSERIRPEWLEEGIEDQIADDAAASPHPLNCQTQSWFARVHRRGGKTLYTALALEDRNLFVGVGLYVGKGVSQLPRVLPDFELNEESRIYWQSEPTVVPDDGAIPLNSLLAASSKAMVAVQEALGRSA